MQNKQFLWNFISNFIFIQMKFICNIQNTALFLAVENNNLEILELLLERQELDVNALSII